MMSLASCARSVMKEIHILCQKTDTLFDGQVEIVLDDGEMDEPEKEIDGHGLYGLPDAVVKFYMNITPNDGLYKNARCRFRVFVDSSVYPEEAPNVQVISRILHPNMNPFEVRMQSTDSNVCVSLLGDEWSSATGLDGMVMAVLYLFYHPQLDDPLTTRVCDRNITHWEFEQKVRQALLGNEINGETFDKLVEVDQHEEGIAISTTEDLVNVGVQDSSGYSETPHTQDESQSRSQMGDASSGSQAQAEEVENIGTNLTSALQQNTGQLSSTNELGIEFSEKTIAFVSFLFVFSFLFLLFFFCIVMFLSVYLVLLFRFFDSNNNGVAMSTVL